MTADHPAEPRQAHAQDRPAGDIAAAVAKSRLQEFRTFRERMNTRIREQQNLVVNRFFALDGQAYRAGALDEKTKEFAGLSASLVLRCDDCIAYHIIRCKEVGASDEEIWEVLGIGLIVGGSIVIPHLRRAVDLLDELNSHTTSDRASGCNHDAHAR